MSGHAQLKFVMTECSKTQIRLTGLSYQNDGTVFICGDLNSRCDDLNDFIVGVDDIPHRYVVDFKTNSYGEILINFLIDANFCILSGRNYNTKDFTSVYVKGLSVVDYCLITI